MQERNTAGWNVSIRKQAPRIACRYWPRRDLHVEDQPRPRPAMRIAGAKVLDGRRGPKAQAVAAAFRSLATTACA